MTHLPGARSPAVPLTRRGLRTGPGRLPRRGIPTRRVSRSCFLGWGATRRAPRRRLSFGPGGQLIGRQRLSGSPALRRGTTAPPQGPGGGGAVSPPCTSMLVALAGSDLALGMGTTTPPPPPVSSNDHFLAPAFVQTLVQELAVDAFFGLILRGAAVTLGKPVDRHGAAILKASRAPPGGAFVVQFGLLYRLGQGAVDRLCIPAGAGAPRVPRRATRRILLAGLRRGGWCDAWPCGWGRTWTWRSRCAGARGASGPRRSTADRVASSIPCRFPRGAAA
jgi:hypothetical protein